MCFSTVATSQESKDRVICKSGDSCLISKTVFEPLWLAKGLRFKIQTSAPSTTRIFAILFIVAHVNKTVISLDPRPHLVDIAPGYRSLMHHSETLSTVALSPRPKHSNESPRRNRTSLLNPHRAAGFNCLGAFGVHDYRLLSFDRELLEVKDHSCLYLCD